jgi:hypothetical protein
MTRVIRSAATLASVAIFAAACSDGQHPSTPLLGPTATAESAGLGPPMTGGGTGEISELLIDSSRQAGGNVIQERTLRGTVSGTLDGAFEERVRGVIHANGLVTFQGTMEFFGTVAGCGDGPGYLKATLSGRGIAGLPVADASFRLVDQASNTLDVRGTGTLSQVGRAMTYEVRYVCR